MTNDLDARARTAAAALHESVRDLPVPTATTPRWRPSLAVAVVSIVAVVAVAIAVRNQGSDDTDVVTDNDGGVPRLVLETPPAGMLPTGAIDLPLGGNGAITQTYWVYGDPQAADPFASGDLGVVVSTGQGSEFVPPDDAREVEVGGRSAWVATSRDPLEPRSITLEVAAGPIVYLASRSLSDDELIHAAGEIDVERDAPTSLGGLALVAVSSGEPTGSTPVPLPATLGHIVGYQTEDDSLNKVISVVSVAGGEDAYLVARWALGQTSRAIAIRGSDGWVGSPFGDTSTIVVWRESPTTFVAVSAFGLDESATLDAVASLKIATDDEWTALLRDSSGVRVPSSAQAGVSGTAENGLSFAVYVDADGLLCLDVETAGGSEGMCGAGSGPLTVQVGALGDDGTVVVYGLTTLGTDGEVRITADDGPAGSEAYYEDGTVFAFTVLAEQVPEEIVVRAADGTELGRAAVPAPGSATFEGTATTMSG